MPQTPYHGTGIKYTALIDAEGLHPKGRLYVHLSKDPVTQMKQEDQMLCDRKLYGSKPEKVRDICMTYPYMSWIF